MKEPKLIEQYADNGEHSHWHLIDEIGQVLWSSFPEETIAKGEKIISSSINSSFSFEDFKDIFTLGFDKGFSESESQNNGDSEGSNLEIITNRSYEKWSKSNKL